MQKRVLGVAIASVMAMLAACGSEVETADIPDRTPEEAIAAYVDTIDLDPDFERVIGEMRDDTLASFGPENEIGLPPGSTLDLEQIGTITDETYRDLIARSRGEFVKWISENMDPADIETLERALTVPEQVEGLRCYEDAYYTGFNESDACLSQYDIPDEVMTAQRKLFDAGRDYTDDPRTLTLLGSTQCDLVYRLTKAASEKGQVITIHDVEVKIEYRKERTCEELAAARLALEPDYQPFR